MSMNRWRSGILLGVLVAAACGPSTTPPSAEIAWLCSSAADCDDGNPCTDQTCLQGICAWTNHNKACDDGDPCTLNDACAGGACTGDPLDEDGDGYVGEACGGDDCLDHDPAVNPGVREGPQGHVTCSDKKDNDCDGGTDAQDPGCIGSNASIVADHRACLQFDDIPEPFIEQVKEGFRIAYGHSSHGSQIVAGMAVLMGSDELYSFNTAGSAGALSLHDSEPDGDLGEPDRVTWARRTRELLDSPANDRNLIVWSWCGQVSDATRGEIQTYLSLMDELERDYPDVAFVYMTGHLDETGEQGNLHLRNSQIREFCAANRKILFDFADIESYDPDGTYFVDKNSDDKCYYWEDDERKNWAEEWCAANPGSELCVSCTCAHSRPLNCNLKARAFWWLLARVAGWDGT